MSRNLDLLRLISLLLLENWLIERLKLFQKRVATGLLILAGIFVSSWTAAVGCVFGHAQTMSLTNNGKFRAANLQWIPAIGKRRFRFHAGHRGRSDSCRILVGNHDCVMAPTKAAQLANSRCTKL